MTSAGRKWTGTEVAVRSSRGCLQIINERQWCEIISFRTHVAVQERQDEEVGGGGERSRDSGFKGPGKIPANTNCLKFSISSAEARDAPEFLLGKMIL